MDEIRNIKDRLLNSNNLSLMAILGNVVFVIYLVVVRENDLKNNVLDHDKRLSKIEAQIGDLRERKVDKETFIMINDNLNALRSDIRDIKNSFIDHINKDIK